MFDFLHHLFVPRESNNHRPKLLHHKSLLFIIAILFVGQFALFFGKTNFSSVLGLSTNVSVQEMLTLVNQERQQRGLSTLVINEQLTKAAYQKGQDMLAKNYWSHNAPDGATPWVFIKNEGYNYVYAGENLARGFTNSNDVVKAWMESPSHRDNIISKNYQDIGFAVLEGKLLGEDTVLIVEMFGNTGRPIAQIPVATQRNTGVKSTNIEKSIIQQPLAQNTQNNLKGTFSISQALVSVTKKEPLFDSLFLSKNIGIIILSLFIFVLTLDIIVVERKKIVRLVGHNIDHILFLSVILIFVIIFGKGVVL